MADTLFEVYIHIIFATWESINAIPESQRLELHKYIAKSFVNEKCHHVIVGGTNNHVHILTSMPKNELINNIIRKIKVATNHILNVKNPYLKFQWQHGYACFSVNPQQLGIVKKYINNQMEHHHNISFQDELKKFCLKYGIDYQD